MALTSIQQDRITSLLDMLENNAPMACLTCNNQSNLAPAIEFISEKVNELGLTYEYFGNGFWQLTITDNVKDLHLVKQANFTPKQHAKGIVFSLGYIGNG